MPISAWACTVSAAVPAELFAQSANALPPASTAWDAGSLGHLLPAVSNTRMLIKASFRSPLQGAPQLRIGGITMRGTMSDTRGELWQFHASGLEPGRCYSLIALPDKAALASVAVIDGTHLTVSGMKRGKRTSVELGRREIREYDGRRAQRGRVADVGQKEVDRLGE